MVSVYLNYFLKALSPNTVIFLVGVQHMNLGGTQFNPEKVAWEVLFMKIQILFMTVGLFFFFT